MSLYDAFVSYSHAKDKPIAAALQTVIQKLGKPWYRRRMLRVFRDDTSLAATPELWPTLEKTLDQSRFILILASPQFAKSKWCGMEVAHWLKHKSLDTLLIAVTDGDLKWDDAAADFVWDETTPLPAVVSPRCSTAATPSCSAVSTSSPATTWRCWPATWPSLDSDSPLATGTASPPTSI